MLLVEKVCFVYYKSEMAYHFNGECVAAEALMCEILNTHNEAINQNKS